MEEIAPQCDKRRALMSKVLNATYNTYSQDVACVGPFRGIDISRLISLYKDNE